MLKLYPICRVLVITIFTINNLFASDNETDNNNLTPFTNLDKNFMETFSNWNALYHLAAVGFTYISVNTGIDAAMLRATSKLDVQLSSGIGHSGILLGYFAPLAIPATMYFSAGQDNPDLRTASYAVMQSVGMAFIIGSVLKAVTGRRAPNPDAVDKIGLSKDFNFGFMRGGLHYGWPSGHLMVNTAMATTLAAYYPEKRWVKTFSYGYISFLLITVLIHDRGSAHWFSDIVAGTLMGVAIGTTIGKNFYQQRRKTMTSQNDHSQISSMQCYPLIYGEYNGITLQSRF